MSEPVAPASPAPGGEAPAAPAPAAPAAPAPVTPAADIKPGQPDADQAEQNEWDDAADEIFPGVKSSKKGDKNEPTKPEKTPEEIAAEQAAADGKKPEAQPGASDDTKPQGAADEEAGAEPGASEDPAAAERNARAAARVAAQQAEAIKTDVRTKMFGDVPETLADADGDPITSIDDVMRLINPRTGETFTEEEAGMWLLSAQQKFNQQKAEIDRTIDKIADLQLDIKDQADSVNAKYGAWLKANPEKRDEIWLAYEKTLIKHQESGLIIHAPTSLEWFYDQVVGPQVAAAPAAPAAPAEPAAPVETPEQKAAREKAEADAAEAERKRKRADRSPIYGGSNLDTRDDEDKEWDEAAEAVFPHLKNERK